MSNTNQSTALQKRAKATARTLDAVCYIVQVFGALIALGLLAGAFSEGDAQYFILAITVAIYTMLVWGLLSLGNVVARYIAHQLEEETA